MRAQVTALAPAAATQGPSAAPATLSILDLGLEAANGEPRGDEPPDRDHCEVPGREAAALRVRAEAGFEGLGEVAEREDVRDRLHPLRCALQRVEDARDEQQREQRQVGGDRRGLGPPDEGSDCEGDRAERGRAERRA